VQAIVEENPVSESRRSFGAAFLAVVAVDLRSLEGGEDQ